MECIVSELSSLIEQDLNPSEDTVTDDYNKYLNEMIEELNKIPDILYELSLIDDKYEEALSENDNTTTDTNNQLMINENKLDILVNKVIFEEYTSELREAINTIINTKLLESESVILQLDDNTSYPITDIVFEHTFVVDELKHTS
jgi:hypothetical protein